MHRPLRAVVLLILACGLAEGRSTLSTPTQQIKQTSSDMYGKLVCAEELRMVFCGIPESYQKAADQAIRELCCTVNDVIQSSTPTSRRSTGATASPVQSRSSHVQTGSNSSSVQHAPVAAVRTPPVSPAVTSGNARLSVPHKVPERAAEVSDAQETEGTTRALRPDLDPEGPLSELQPKYYYGACTQMQEASIPVFSTGINSIQIKQQIVPLRLRKAVIRQTKTYAINHLSTTNFRGYGRLAQNMTAKDSLKVQNTYYELRAVNPASGFVHPGCVVGPAELALMKERLADDVTLQDLALKSLLTGSGVPPKVMRQWVGTQLYSWTVPTDTPLKYDGPFAMQSVDTKYNGLIANSSECPDNYPAGAPRDNCGHVALVELDAQQAYKQAMAYWATGNVEYAKTALDIIEAWASDNKKFGVAWENGPLEAGWSVASFARALELLRGRVDGWDHTYVLFKEWVDTILMPLMDYYTNTTDAAIKGGKTNVLGNWHSTIAEAWMTVGILTDDRPRYARAVDLYHATIKDYFKWGRGKFHRYSGVLRIVGEATETMRDIYHTQFAIGGLLQTAEMAWQQDEDIYSSYGYALAAAMELQAKIILAHNETTNMDDESALPAGFKVQRSMPPPPANCSWRFDIEKQLWTAVNDTSGAWVSDLKDGVKYIVGNGYLPTGWELGYNHYVGRLGMRLPETTALIQKHNIEWYSMHFGLGTLSHANTAALLWRVGLKKVTVCKGKQKQQ